MTSRDILILAGAGLAASGAQAQLAIVWNSIDGGGRQSLTAGSLTLSGTVGQADAGTLGIGPLTINGGFWTSVAVADCYANCDGSTGTPTLSPADFSCFLSRYRAGDPYANCDNSTGAPALSPADFSCFLAKYRAGCP